MIFALDSNILIYMTGVARIEADIPKIAAIIDMAEQLSGNAKLIAPLQALGETYVVLQRMGLDRKQSRKMVLGLKSRLPTVAATDDTFQAALDLATDHKLQFWDALILNAAADAGCTLLLSEDLHAGFAWRGVTVADPFAEVKDRQLVRAMRG